MPLPIRLRKQWTAAHLIGAVLLMAAGAAVTLPAWIDIFRIAIRDQEASHIFLVPLIAVWLIWARRGRFRSVMPTGRWAGPLIVAVGWAMSYFGFYHAVQAAWHAGAIVVVVGCLLSVVGTDVLWRFLPAFVVMAFLVPVPGMIRQMISIPLQQHTAVVTQAVLELVGAPVELHGLSLTYKDVPVTIAEACNGMRMVFALVLVSYGFAFGTPLRGYVRVLILAASPISAILCNVVRLIPTVWIHGNYPRQVGESFHNLSGWVMLPVAFLILLGIIRLLRWALIPVSPFTLAYE